ncbi:MAG: phosphodiester glycosidase family protein [Candidatus Saganbacteria bacterium]|nr:phosphodiester glycosidase family protein [Candidatus Saganbacteria bacterium]
MRRNKPFIFLSVLLLVIVGTGICQAATLKKIRYHSYPDKLRIILDLSEPAKYSVSSAEGFISISMANTSAGGGISNVTQIEKEIINYIGCEKLNDNLKIGLYLKVDAPYRIFALDGPPRIVIDCSRDFSNLSKPEFIAPGVEYFEVTQGVTNGQIQAHVLKIDPYKAKVKPFLAIPKKEPQSFFDSLKEFFSTIFEEEEEGETPSFSSTKVSDMVKQSGAIAGVNGTFFAPGGMPLGMLMIDKEIITLPPYERTALAITSDHKAYIDTFLSATYFSLKDKSIYEITRINEPRGTSDSVLFTPRYGSRTKTKPGGFEIVVQKGEIVAINLKNSLIPSDGYVISVSGAPLENLGEKAKIGDPIKLSLTLIPFSYSSKEDILHLVGGGPRLLKGGQIYVSKFMERFKKDIAQGRAARTAVGVTKDEKILLVTIDGKVRAKGKKFLSQEEDESIGLTLEELSELLLSLGATDAMNLDGGGSSAMAVNGKLISSPVDGVERRVSNSILVLPR